MSSPPSLQSPGRRGSRSRENVCTSGCLPGRATASRGVENQVLPALQLSQHLCDRSCVRIALLVSVLARLAQRQRRPPGPVRRDGELDVDLGEGGGVCTAQ
eukprot:2025132-Prymnesium_polylepis.1